MALQFSNYLAAFSASLGSVEKFSIYSGAKPADCLAATTGTLLAEKDLTSSSEWLRSPTYPDSWHILYYNLYTKPMQLYAIATGTPGYWRMWSDDEKTNCVAQGECGVGKSLPLGAISAVGQGIQILDIFSYGPNEYNQVGNIDIQNPIQLIKVWQSYALLALPHGSNFDKYLRLYTGSVPANISTAATGTKLSEALLPYPLTTLPGSGTSVVLDSTPLINFIASGTATYFRIAAEISAGVFEDIMQGTVGLVGSGADMEMINNVIVSGQLAYITEFTLDGASMT